MGGGKQFPDSCGVTECTIPKVVANEETIARALFQPIHFSNSGKIRGAAFKAPSGKMDVSVMRSSYLSRSECCRRAAEMQKEGKLFAGFALLCVSFVRNLQLNVEDSRQIFCGHADIWHHQPFIKGEPPSPDINIVLDALAKHALLVTCEANNPLIREDC